ncbi:unnamed protein product [Pleuronectes platessa]|uniref:PDZ domain-containing protein n=1 Tax=Pleuronectes platessa TaxID=8262 RepID=A0A9N7ZDZ4_PLEPL|nr:unnamed protein product [Pleuronectes platessa]
MSKVIQKKNHWITKVRECAVVRDACGALSLELRGGAENGEFPHIGPLREDALDYQEGKLCEGELLLEVEGLPVSGLPLYDILAVMKCCQGPVRFRTVRQVCWAPMHNWPGTVIQAVPDQTTERAVGLITGDHIASVALWKPYQCAEVARSLLRCTTAPTGVFLQLRNAERKEHLNEIGAFLREVNHYPRQHPKALEVYGALITGGFSRGSV